MMTLALAVLASTAHAAEVVIEPSVTYQTLLGYGQGGMDQNTVPWYTMLSANAREELLDRLYTLQGDGLGLTICRTYLCAGDAPGHSHMARQPGGSRHPLGYEPEEGRFQWEGREASLWHARGARARGALMVAFFNSPPWWLTVSGCTAGAAEGVGNLRGGAEDRFAVYVCEVLQHYRDAWGVDFDRVSPINEPEANWWVEGGGQDGCHVDARQATVFLAALAARLREHRLRARLQAPEAAFSASLGYLDILLGDERARGALADLTCHQYQTDFHSLRRWPLRARLHGKPLWMSEWGDWTNRGITLALNYARKLHEAHRLMQAVAWCMWEPGFLLDREGDRLEPNPAYYAVAQFTRFARPGMVLVEASDAAARTTCYLDREARRLVLITVNDSSDPLPLRYDLSGFAGLGSIERRRTSAAECLATLPPLPCTDGFLDTLPPQSVTTFVTSYTAIRKPLLGNGGFETGTLGPWHGEPAELTGVQDTYPQGGSYDGFIDLTPNAAGALSQQVTGLRPGARHALTAACATSGIEATLSVTGVGLEAKAGASGGTYRHARVEFTAPADGAVTVAYSARSGDEKGSWATIDNVRLSPLAE